MLAAVPVVLLRVAGRPAWATVYGEDLYIFLVQAIQHPWHLFIPYAGYLQLFPRLVAHVVMYLPLRDAARAFALAGALAAAGSALVAYHASAGHIRSRGLRALLAAAIVLLPVAPLEIIDSGVDLAWYTMLALFFAVLWRPRTRTGMAVAALVAFVTASSDTMVIVFAPLLAIRLFVLRRPRDHAVTAGWLAGCVLQVPVIAASVAGSHGSRLVGRRGTPGQSLAFYAHDVVLPAGGWRFSWWLRDLAGINAATAIMGGLLAVLFGTIMVTQRENRAFAATALGTGFLLSFLASTLSWWVATRPVTPYSESGARYTALPVFLFQVAAIAAVDQVLRGLAARRALRRREAAPWPVRATATLAVVMLIAVLGSAWTADFRYKGYRSGSRLWAPQVTRWERACQHAAAGTITVRTHGKATAVLPCDRLRF